MKEIIKRLYAKELDLIADLPSSVQRKWTDYLARIKDKVWVRHSIAMRIAIVAMIISCPRTWVTVSMAPSMRFVRS